VKNQAGEKMLEGLKMEKIFWTEVNFLKNRLRGTL